MSKCQYCPIGPDARCCAEIDGRYRYACKPGMTASEVAAVKALSGVEPSGPPAPDVRPDLGDQLRLLKLARECPHREAAECGCNYGRCALDGRDKSVQDCLECVGGAR